MIAANLIKLVKLPKCLFFVKLLVKILDTVTYLVSKNGGLEARKAWDKLVGRRRSVTKGTRAVKGGLSVEFEGLRGFIPASMIDTRFVRNTEQFVASTDAKLKKLIQLKTVSSFHVKMKLLKQKLQKLVKKSSLNLKLVQS